MLLSAARSCSIVLVALTACAGSRNQPRLHSAAESTAYALQYPETLASAQRTFAADKQLAHALSNGLAARVNEIKVGAEPALPLRVVDEADAAGTSEAYARARTEERSFSTFWAEERAAVGARASAAAQKELADGQCANKDLAPAVQHALKEGLDKPLERRLRAYNEAQRTLELHKARLLPGTLPVWQRAADEIALASHYARVLLREDAHELERLLAEQSAVHATLSRAIDDERKIQTDPRGGEQKASQDRVVLIEKARASVPLAADQARAARSGLDDQLSHAEVEYSQALAAIREHLRALPAAPSAPPAKPAPVVAKPTASTAKP
jgi:hypothetical protein